MKQQDHRDGYLKIDISINGERFGYFVHRLVAQAFVPNPDKRPQVNHIDGNKANNHVSNLEWVNNSENQAHAIKLGLKRVKVGKEATRFEGTIHAWDNCGKLVASMNGNIEMASNGFDFRLVSACLKGKRKTHRGCTFTKTFEKEI
jgi:hypothetical protein